MGTPLATLASRPGRRAAATLAVLLLLAACQADAGAAEQPAEGLLVLTGGDAAELAVLAAKQDSEEPVAIGLPLPDDDATWISAGKDGTLVGSTAGGGLQTSDPVDLGGPAADLAGLEWRPVEAAEESGGSLAMPASFPTWDPGGRRFAALGGDLSGGGDMHLLLVDPGESKATSVALKRALLTAPPAWLDGQRVAMVIGSQDEPATIVVDTATGKVTKGPAGERRLATSGDGSVIATSAGPGAPILLRSSRGWLADDGTSTGSVEVPDGFVDAISLALDQSGRRLAIVWLGEDGVPRYDVHDGTDGWRRVWSQPLPGASAAVVAWLR
jgi:hypothetical protein